MPRTDRQQIVSMTRTGMNNEHTMVGERLKIAVEAMRIKMHHETTRHPHLYLCALNLKGGEGGNKRKDKRESH